MSTESGAPAADAAPAEISTFSLPSDAPEAFDTPEAATRYFLKQKNSAADGADSATAANELGDEPNADPLDAAPGEDEGNEQEAETLPPIARPRSWSQDADDDWNAIPRARQEKIAANEQAREADIRQRINDAAEKLKGASAKEQAAEQARQNYEAKLPAVMQTLLDQSAQQFPNIKSMADVEFLANEALRLSATDPVLASQYSSYLGAWQVHQQKLAHTKLELNSAEQRKATESQAERKTRNDRETALLIEKAPEFADAKKLDAAQKAAAQLFRDVGYSDSELASMGDERILGDHRIQLIINDAMKYRALQSAKTAVTAKIVPQVQRPGTTRPAGGNAERVQALTQSLTNSGSMEDAAALLIARRAANQRRAS